MRKSPEARVYQIKVSLRGVKPQIWRRLLVASSASLDTLHDILQTAMGWSGGHLHQFVTPDGACYSALDPEYRDESSEDESRFCLNQLLRREKDWIVYEYDFGDGWEHKIVLEKILPFDGAATVPSCAGGKRACPPEDCGGVWGYGRLLEVIGDPAHSEHAEMLEWVDDGFDPERFDVERINAILAAKVRGR
jgi:hypothetical protein